MENRDKDRWRNVGVWIIPIVFAVLFTLIFYARGALAIWLSVSAGIVFLGYALFLLEWYVWRERSERKTPRIIFSCLCFTVIAGGLWWQLQPNNERVPDPHVSERPYIRVRIYGVSGLAPGKIPQAEIRVQNVGKTPANRLRLKSAILLAITDQLPDDLPKFLEARYGTKRSDETTLMPTEEAGSLPILDRPLSVEDWANLKSQVYSIHIYIWGEYWDEFGKKHLIEQCNYYDLARPQLFRTCTHYNKPDQ